MLTRNTSPNGTDTLCLNTALLSSRAAQLVFICSLSVTALLPAVSHGLASLHWLHYLWARTLERVVLPRCCVSLCATRKAEMVHLRNPVVLLPCGCLLRESVYLQKAMICALFCSWCADGDRQSGGKNDPHVTMVTAPNQT